MEARRALKRRCAAALMVLAVVPAACAQECGATLGGRPTTIEDAHYTVAYVVTPDPIVVGSHFVVAFAVCAHPGAPAPLGVRVDATMPEHRHGMNYRPTVASVAPGVYRAEGLLFHMPGRWDLTFDVEAAGRTERLTRTLRVE